MGDLHLLFFASFLAHSQMGQTQTSAGRFGMSGLPPIADGEYRCPTCDELLEVLDGSRLVAYRLTIQPSRNRDR